MQDTPRVSIGLIVYNGENYLAEAIDSLLAQTYRDFELIISDNCSTDGTESICSGYAEQDPRVRYVRADKNHGATWNHNRVIELARGEFFKLAAHDDLCEPGFIEACVKVLDENPDAIVGYTDAKYLRGNRRHSMRIHRHTPRTEAGEASTRFQDMIEAELQGFQVFGCIRTSALRLAKPFGTWTGADRLFMAELALLGPFARVADPLFIYRLHPEQSISMVDRPAQYIAWWRSGNAPQRVYPQWRFLRELFSMVWRVDLPFAEKLRCYQVVLNWGWKRRKELIGELKALSPVAHSGRQHDQGDAA